MQGRTAVIVGGSMGIGKAAAKGLADADRMLTHPDFRQKLEAIGFPPHKNGPGRFSNNVQGRIHGN